MVNHDDIREAFKKGKKSGEFTTPPPPKCGKYLTIWQSKLTQKGQKKTFLKSVEFWAQPGPPLVENHRVYYYAILVGKVQIPLLVSLI